MGIWNGLKGAAAGLTRSRAQRQAAKPTTPLYRRWWMLLIFGIIGVQAMSAYDRYTTPPPAPMTAEERAAQAQFEEAQRVQKQKDREALGLVLQAVATVKANLKNPASFELVSATLMPDDAVCLVYRGTNSFNAIITEQATAMGAVVSKSSNQWNKYCAGQSGKDYAGHIQGII